MRSNIFHTSGILQVLVVIAAATLHGCGWMAADTPAPSAAAQESVAQAQADGDLFRLYVALASAVDDGSVTARRADFFTDEYLQAVDPANDKSLYLLKLTQYVDKVDSYHQQRDDKRGCLTLNGFDKSKEPVVLAIEYRNPADRWLVNNVHLGFAASTLDFVNQPVCPEEQESR